MSCANSRTSRLRKRLLDWGKENIKRYDWRYSDDPYAVLVAEFMLHRTQVVQVAPVYARFMSAYPSLSTYVRADEAEVEAILRPLGLRWRIRAMMQALHELWENHGSVPTDFEKLNAVSGVGQYIAGATACFSQNQALTLIDTNTVRVVGRVFGLDLRGQARRRKSVTGGVGEACDPVQPRDFYYALIDLAHTVCSPREPDCRQCPLLDVPCQFGQDQMRV